MVIQNNTIPMLTSPPKDWGLTEEKATFKDWQSAIILMAITAIVFVSEIVGFVLKRELFVNMESGGVMETILVGSIGVSIVLLITSVVSALIASDLPHRRLVLAQYQAMKTWERETLMPFLEGRYGLKISKDEPMFSDWSYPKALHNGRHITFRLNGVNTVYVDFHNSTQQYVEIDSNGITVDEVIDPRQVTYVPLQEV